MLNFHQTFVKRNKSLLCCLSERYFAKIRSLAKLREIILVHAKTTHVRLGMENPAISWVIVLGGLATLNYLQWWIILNGLGAAHKPNKTVTFVKVSSNALMKMHFYCA